MTFPYMTKNVIPLMTKNVVHCMTKKIVPRIAKNLVLCMTKNVVPCVTSNVVPCMTKNNASGVFKNQSSVTHGSCRIILGFQQSNKASNFRKQIIIAIKLAEWKVHNAFFFQLPSFADDFDFNITNITIIMIFTFYVLHILFGRHSV